MRIHKLQMDSFGRFQDKTVELAEGLNVLVAPNESGKSTLAAFIKYMLYGFKSERTSKSNPIKTKTQFTPWTGTDPAGSMVFSRDGQSLTATRSGVRPCTLQDTLTGLPVVLDRELGEGLYGVSVDTFESTAFFGQSALSYLSMEEIEIRLKNLATGAEEGVSYDRARTALGNARNKIENGRGGGAANLLRRQMEEISLEMTRADRQAQDLAELSGQTLRLREALARKEAEMREIQREMETENRRIEEEYARRFAEMEDQLTQTQARMEQLNHRLGGVSREQAQNAYRDAQRLATLMGALNPRLAPPEKPKKRIGLLIAALSTGFLGALCAFAALGRLPGMSQDSLENSLACGRGLAADVRHGPCRVFFLDLARAKGRYQEVVEQYEHHRVLAGQAAGLQKQLSAVLGGAEDIPAALEAMSADLAQLEREDALRQKLSMRLENLSLNGQHAASERLRGLTEGLSAAQQKSHEIQVTLTRVQAQLEERTEQAAAIDLLESALNEKRLRAQDLKKLYETYTLALEALDKAHLNMTHLYSPRLADGTAQYFSQITGDSGRGVTVDAKGLVHIKEGATLRPLAYYSAGTADAVYISLRLALLDMLYPDEKPTLIFDDSFSNFDHRRAQSILQTLEQLADKVQILYCTCRDPETAPGGAAYHTVVW